MGFAMRGKFALLTACAALAGCEGQLSAAQGLGEKLALIELPPGFEISVYAEGVENARQLALGERGTVFAGSRKAGKVHAVVDSDGDGAADKVYLIDDGLSMPSGIAFRDGSLYVAAVDRILRYDGIEDALDNPPDPVLVTGALPDKTHCCTCRSARPATSVMSRGLPRSGACQPMAAAWKPMPGGCATASEWHSIRALVNCG
jgi:hypothetical protein